MNGSYPTKLKSFQRKIVQMGALQVAKFHTKPYNFVACLPNPYKLSILGDNWRATILSFSSSKYFYSWQRLSNLVDLSFEYLSFSDKGKTTILFPSPLTFLQWPIRWKARVTFRVMKLGCYVIVDDGGNYVTFHELNVRIKIKK